MTNNSAPADSAKAREAFLKTGAGAPRHRFGNSAPALVAAGWDIIPIPGAQKRPIEDGWQKKDYTPAIIAELAERGYSSGNVGLRTRLFPALDIDIYDEEVAAAIEDAALATLGFAPIRYGNWPKRLLQYRLAPGEAPFGKIQVWLTGPAGARSPDGHDIKVELMGDGQQVVAYGRHPEGYEYRWDGQGPLQLDPDVDLPTLTRAQAEAFITVALPAALPAGWTVSRGRTSAGGTGSDEADSFDLARISTPLPDLTLEQAATALTFIDPDVGYDEWVQVGMALYHQWDGDVEALEVWETWSAEGGKYVEGECADKWDSFSAKDGGVTMASVLKRANQERARRATEIKQGLLTRARGANTQEAIEELAAEARSLTWDMLGRVDRAILAQLINQALKRIVGEAPGIAVARSMVKPTPPDDPGENMPAWASHWVWVAYLDKFMATDTKECLTERSFNARYNRKLAAMADDQGVTPRASSICLDLWGTPTVDRILYAPSLEDTFWIDGISYANLYRPDLVPEPPGELSRSETRALSLFETHMRILVPVEEERNMVLDWMAWCVQNPGRKVRWAVLLKGMQGDGKSYLANVLRAAMGSAQVRVVDSSTLERSDFTGWAGQSAIVVIEEVKMHGHNRWDITNKLKPMISNTVVEIHPKGRDPFNAPNPMSFMLFTNFEDAVPMEEHDRRYFVVFSPFFGPDGPARLHAKILEETGLTRREYNHGLHELGIYRHPGAFRQYFLQREIAEAFDPNGEAPMTAAKQAMIEMSSSSADDGIESAIEEQRVGVYADIVSVRHLIEGGEGDASELRTSMVANRLGRLGFRYAGRVSWDAPGVMPKRRTRVYVMDGAFEDTLPGSLVEILTKREIERLESGAEATFDTD